MDVKDSIAELVGNTPMVRLHRFGKDLQHNLLAKCEFLNPGGSVKDRIAFHMVQRAEEAGQLKPGGTIIEATAGNTGIGLALVAALKGYELITIMSEKVSKDKVKLLEALGAQTVIVPSGKPVGDPDHMLTRARSLAESTGGWLADQFYNESNVETHYHTTGPEIWEQTGGTVDVLVVGVGTGGTLTGAGGYLKEKKPSVKIVLADPKGSLLADFVHGKAACSSSYLVEGIGQDFLPGNFDMSLVDDVVQVPDTDSVATAKRLLQDEAMFVGSSSGCILAAAVAFCQQSGGDAVGTTAGGNAVANAGGKAAADAGGTTGARLNVVVVLPDGGRGYMSTIYDDAWLRDHLKGPWS
jgi:cystathionine beta-synthase